MKNIILILALFLVSNLANAVCVSPISRDAFTTNQKLTSTRLNLEFNTVYARANELPGDCITTGSVTTTQINDGTILNADISASAAIARSKLGTVNYLISGSSGSYSTSSGTYSDVTDLTVTLTTTGNPVELTLISNGSTPCYLSLTATLSTIQIGTVAFLRASSFISTYELFLNSSTSQSFTTGIPGSSARFIDVVSAGTHVYKVQAKALGAGVAPVFSVNNCKLIAREL